MKKRILTFFMLLLLVLAATGCGSKESEKEESETATRIFVDSLGREVEIPEKVTRIVPSGSLAQIFLYAAAPDSLIAVSGAWSDDAADYIDSKYLELPDVGQFFGSNDLNFEEIVELNPQLIVDVGEAKDSLEEDMNIITEKTGIPVVHISADIETMGETFKQLGVLLGVEEHTAKISAYCEKIYTNTIDLMKKIDADGARKRLLYCVGEDGLNVIGKNSYQSQIIDLISDNAAVIENPSSKGLGNEIDIEQLLKWNPEVIIFAPDTYYDEVKSDSVWSDVIAIKNDTYYEAPFGPYNWMGFPPASNRILGMVWMTQLLYPEYAQYDMRAETMEYYELFYHCKLTDAQYESLTANSMMKVEK